MLEEAHNTCELQALELYELKRDICITHACITSYLNYSYQNYKFMVLNGELEQNLMMSNSCISPLCIYKHIDFMLYFALFMNLCKSYISIMSSCFIIA